MWSKPLYGAFVTYFAAEATFLYLRYDAFYIGVGLVGCVTIGFWMLVEALYSIPPD